MKLLMLDDEEISKQENYLLSNSEWRVKAVGNQSCMRLGITSREFAEKSASGPVLILGQEVLGSRPGAQTCLLIGRIWLKIKQLVGRRSIQIIY